MAKEKASKKEKEEQPEEVQQETDAAEETTADEQDGQADSTDSSDEEVVEETAPALEADPRHELSRDQVIDIEALLKPIAGDSPAGEYLRYEGVYDEISEARRADDILDQGAWQAEFKVADFRRVIDLAVPVIETRSKDLQILAWLCEALTAEHGFTGARDGLKLFRLMLERFWDNVFPEIDEGNEEGRANALDWADSRIADLLRKAPITADGWGLNGHRDSKIFDLPENIEGLSSDEQVKASALREQAERENRATAKAWRKAVRNTRRAFCEIVDVAIEECREEYQKLNAAVEEKFDRNQAPSLPDIGKALTEIKDVSDKILAQKRVEEPDPSDSEGIEGEADAEGGGKMGARSGPIRNRSDALRRLSEVAAFFRNTEPHSPVSYLVNRAVSWGNMPLETWLQDVIKDQNILAQLRQTLGFNTVPDGEPEAERETESTPDEPPNQDLQPLQ